MEKYLISLLELNNRVIIPDLGAFIVRQQDPKELVFNDLLAFDDGMLCDRLIQDENISKTEAQNRIRQFVEKARKALEKGEVYNLENLGTLKMDSSSRIEFSGSGMPAGIKETEAKIPVVEKPAVKKTAAKPETAKKPAAKVTKAKPEAAKKPAAKVTKAKTETAKKPAAKVTKAKPEAAKKPTVKEKEAKPETAESEPKEAAVEKTAESTPVIPPETKQEDGGFILAGSDEKVDVDATTEDTPIQAAKEEPPFQIEDTVPDMEKAIAADLPDTAEEETGPVPGTAEDTGSLTEAAEEKKPEEVKKEVPKEEVSPVRKKPIYKFETAEAEESSASGYTSSYQKKKRAWPWIVAILFLIIVLLAVAWFFFPEQVDRVMKKDMTTAVSEEDIEAAAPEMPEEGQTETGSGSVEEELSTGQEETSPGQEEMAASEEAETAAFQAAESSGEEIPRTPGVKMYYVVAGCFASLDNARNYERLLRDQGYEASIFGTWKDLHAVCFSSHTTREAALYELRNIRSSHDTKAWLLYY
jgi:nucleoid DNA-binding protein